MGNMLNYWIELGVIHNTYKKMNNMTYDERVKIAHKLLNEARSYICQPLWARDVSLSDKQRKLLEQWDRALTPIIISIQEFRNTND